MKSSSIPRSSPTPGRASKAAAPGAEWVNAADEPGRGRADARRRCLPRKDHARQLLARADRLRWVQVVHGQPRALHVPGARGAPLRLTNMRGLFGDVIADQVMGYVLCFARNLHTYIRRQIEHRYEPVGGESARVQLRRRARATVNAMDRATIYLPDATLGIVGFGAIGCEIARRALAFGMTVRGGRPVPGADDAARRGRVRRGDRPAPGAAGRGATSR